MYPAFFRSRSDAFYTLTPLSAEWSVLCQGRVTLSLRIQKSCPILLKLLSDSHQNWQVASSVIQLEGLGLILDLAHPPPPQKLCRKRVQN